jgi:hypothetical protein
LTDNPVFYEFAHLTYYFANFIFFGVIFSFFYSVTNGNIWSRILRRNVGARHFLCIFLIFILAYYLGERFLSDKIIDEISKLSYTTIPLAVLSVSLTAFYIVKVIAERRLRFPDSIFTMCLSILAFAVTIIMISNGNKIPFLQQS